MTDIERFIDWAEFLGVDASEAFEVAVNTLDHFGREYVTLENTDCAASMGYLNQGETYALTLVLTDDNELLAISWGDWYENAEREYCEEHDAVRCGYCGEFTECAEEWSETVCESCGNLVGG